MATASQVDGVRALAARAVEQAGLVLEDVSVVPAGRRSVLRVVVDLPDDVAGGVPVDAVAQASHAVSAALDSSDVMGGTPYVLEVTSPGVERPLTQRRHWARARGRLVRATLNDGSEVSGRLLDVLDDAVIVGGRHLPWGDLARGQVELEFSRGADLEADADADAEFDDVASEAGA